LDLFEKGAGKESRKENIQREVKPTETGVEIKLCVRESGVAQLLRKEKKTYKRAYGLGLSARRGGGTTQN